MIEVLKKMGYRLTRTRREIIQIFLENTKDHLSARDLHKILIKRGVRCNLSTVYRTINLLFNLGLIHRTNFNETHAHYEYSHDHEIHLYCEHCGKIIEIELKNQIVLPPEVSFQPKRQLTIITGICKDCQQKR